MSKFSQLADDIASDLKEMDNDADELNARRLKAKESARVAVNVHHSAYNRIEAGIDALEQVGRDLMGSNSDNDAEAKAKVDKAVQASTEESAKLGEGSGATSNSSFLPEA